MCRDNSAISGGIVCRCSATLAALLLLLGGCGSPESCLERNFSSALVSKARSGFKIDKTDWQLSDDQAVQKRLRVVVRCEAGVMAGMRDFCEQKVLKCLYANGFELDLAEEAELMVCVVRASEIRRPVRTAKVRIAAKVCLSEDADPVMQGIADGIVTRPDLSAGVWMPRSSFCRAAQHAVSKLMHQLSNIPKATPSPPLEPPTKPKVQ